MPSSAADGEGVGAVKIVELNGENILVAKLPPGAKPGQDYEIGLAVHPKSLAEDCGAQSCDVNCLPDCGCWSKVHW